MDMEAVQMSQDEQMISIPASALINARPLDDIDDWVQANDPEFVAAMQRIGEAELAGCERHTPAELKKKWNW
jgi:hypothetical protein